MSEDAKNQDVPRPLTAALFGIVLVLAALLVIPRTPAVHVFHGIYGKPIHALKIAGAPLPVHLACSDDPPSCDRAFGLHS